MQHVVQSGKWNINEMFASQSFNSIDKNNFMFFLIVEVNHNHLIYELYLKQLFLENSSKRIIEETGKQ